MNSHLALPPELTIYTATEVRLRCLDWLLSDREAAQAGALEGEFFDIDAQAVAEVDGAGVQLLLALSQSIEQAHRVMRLCQPSHQLVEACTALGAGALCDLSGEVAENAGAAA